MCPVTISRQKSPIVCVNHPKLKISATNPKLFLILVCAKTIRVCEISVASECLIYSFWLRGPRPGEEGCRLGDPWSSCLLGTVSWRKGVNVSRMVGLAQGDPWHSWPAGFRTSGDILRE